MPVKSLILAGAGPWLEALGGTRLFAETSRSAPQESEFEIPSQFPRRERAFVAIRAKATEGGEHDQPHRENNLALRRCGECSLSDRASERKNPGPAQSPWRTLSPSHIAVASAAAIRREGVGQGAVYRCGEAREPERIACDGPVAEPALAVIEA